MATVTEAQPKPPATTTVQRRLMSRDLEVTPEAEEVHEVEEDVSYTQQYKEVFSHLPLAMDTPIKKPSAKAQASELGAKPIPGSDIYAVPQRQWWNPAIWDVTDWVFMGVLGSQHALCLFAPMTFSWNMFALFVAGYIVTGCFGITLSYHRQLSHRSFQTPKWLEYLIAYCGVLAIQGDPIEWVTAHRYHHLHTDTALDPHSPYEGFWFSHLGWLLDHRYREFRVSDQSNTKEMQRQFFYRLIRNTYPLHSIMQFCALYYFAGFPGIVWGGAMRICWVYHNTWTVNSVAHVWGSQTYNTGDLSRNNWLVALLTFGEGWHNNHHAFKFSARHGMEWWQLDVTYMIIKTLEALGLAWKVQLPSEAQKKRLAL